MDRRKVISYGLLILVVAVFIVPALSRNSDHGFPRMNMVAQSFWLNTWATDTCAFIAQWDTVFNTDALSVLDSTQRFEQKTQMNIFYVADVAQGAIEITLKGAFRNSYNAYAPEYVLDIASAVLTSQRGLVEWDTPPKLEEIDIGYDSDHTHDLAKKAATRHYGFGIFDDYYIVVQIETEQELMMKATGEGY